MKRLIYLIIAICFSSKLSFGQIQKNIDPNTNQITIGVVDTLQSEKLGEEREIWIHVPKSSINGQKYPVIYLLDGEFHFESVVGIVRSSVINKLIPEMIIVAISNTNRYRDLTTSHVGDDINPSGGGENFVKFIESELIPYLDNNYPTITHRTLIGHSLGGLVATYVFTKHSQLFDNYLVIDPSLGWDNQKLLLEARQQIKDGDYENKAIYIAIANTINNGQSTDMSFEKAIQDSTNATLHLRSIHEFSQLAQSNEQLVSEWKYYPEETHGTVPIIAQLDAFRFFFSWYKFEHWNEFYKPEPELTGEQLAGLIVSHYDTISDKLGYLYLPNEQEINSLAYMYLSKNDSERALPFFKLNVKNYPKSANAHDSMGDYYMSVSDTTNAIKYYSLSLKLGGVNGTKEKLEELTKGK